MKKGDKVQVELKRYAGDSKGVTVTGKVSGIEVRFGKQFIKISGAKVDGEFETTKAIKV